jgi:hypothetical protein
MKTLLLPVLVWVMLSLVNLPNAHAMVKLVTNTAIAKDIKGVKLSEYAKLDDGVTSLPRITQGLRQKKVVFAWFSVYVAQVFSATAKPDFSSVEKLRESLQKGMPLVFSMTFLRDVGIDKISEGFVEGFKENKMDVKVAPYSDFLSAVQKSGDVVDQQQYLFVFSENAGKESLSFQTHGKEIFSLKDQAQATIESFLDLWFGKPADSGLEQLQNQLLKP